MIFPPPMLPRSSPSSYTPVFMPSLKAESKTDKQNHNKLNISKQKMKQRAPCIPTNKL